MANEILPFIGQTTHYVPGGQGITDAPNDGKMYVRQNDTWVQASSPAGGGPGSGEWTMGLLPTAPPDAGQIRLNNADQALVTHIFVSKTTANEVDVGNIFPLAVKVGADMAIQDKDTSGNWCAYTLNADPVDQGTYFDLSVSFLQEGAEIPALQKCMVVFLR